MGLPEKREYKASQTHHFQPFQIVCLEHRNNRLYAEVIQVVKSRKVCWVRPLVLVVEVEDDLAEDRDLSDQQCYYDLRQDSDLLFPVILFRAALDVEMIPLLTFLYNLDDQAIAELPAYREYGKTDGSGNQKFQQFVQEVWKAYPEAF